ncbi:MAG: DJ-1 family glyoxalase III [Muribaculaceae bacterium]|nr:DJ-1 family glyoxalase III [Muribaculaceae bacterium]
MKVSYLFLAKGFEEIEAITPVDVMRRAGMNVKTVSITSDREVTGANGVTVKADFLFSDCVFNSKEIEWLVIPGGMPGAENLHNFQPLNDLLQTHAANGGKIAAICASPAVVLSPLGILDGREATCYPGMEKLCHKEVKMRDQRVVALEKIITGNGPSSALPFALAIVANSMGESVAQEVGSGMLFYSKSTNMFF